MIIKTSNNDDNNNSNNNNNNNNNQQNRLAMRTTCPLRGHIISINAMSG